MSNPTSNNDTAADVSPTDGIGSAEATENTQPESSNSKELDAEGHAKELQRARSEAARYRTERNQLRPLADKYREMQEAKKSDEQKAAERIAELEKQNQELALSAAINEVAQESGIPASILRGSSKEDVQAHAEAIRSFIDSELTKNESTVPRAPQVPGENAGGTPITDSDWLRKQLTKR